jgi:hypothetical protein
MRKTAILIALLGLAIFAPRVRADQWSKSWNVSGTADLHVDADRGAIHITQGAGNSIQATVTTEGWRISPDEVEVSATQNSNRVEIRVRVPDEHHVFFNWHSRRVEIALTVPAHSHLDLETGFGDVTGDALSDDAHFKTGFGHIDVAQFDGRLDGETGFGDIRANGRFDSLVLDTGFGHVRAEIAPGSRASDDWKISSGFGSVTVRLPADFNANLDAHSGMGGVSADIPLADVDHSSRSELSGRIGSGGSSVQLDTGFGSVHIGRY